MKFSKQWNELVEICGERPWLVVAASVLILAFVASIVIVAVLGLLYVGYLGITFVLLGISGEAALAFSVFGFWKFVVSMFLLRWFLEIVAHPFTKDKKNDTTSD